jgi:DNA-binding MarR family transcriptional regulator
MTTAPLLTPQIIGRAENAHHFKLTGFLAPTGMTRVQWVALTLTATADGDTVETAYLMGRLTTGLKLDPVVVRDTLAELAGLGLLTDAQPSADGQPRVRLTEAGQTRYREIRAEIDKVLVPAYADIPVEDLATAARVLTTITARLDAA